jgi:hypothetical protein
MVSVIGAPGVRERGVVADARSLNTSIVIDIASPIDICQY